MTNRTEYAATFKTKGISYVVTLAGDDFVLRAAGQVVASGMFEGWGVMTSDTLSSSALATKLDAVLSSLHKRREDIDAGFDGEDEDEDEDED